MRMAVDPAAMEQSDVGLRELQVLQREQQSFVQQGLVA
jgi:hypothetical protein